MACVSVSRKDKLQLLNAPDRLHDELRAAVGPWLQDAQVDHKDSFRFRSAFYVKIHGNPWHSDQINEVCENVKQLFSFL